MKSIFISVLGVLLLSAPFALLAQDYPIWHSDPNQTFNEYPTAVANRSGVSASVGFHEEEFLLFDIGYSAYHNIPCNNCGQESIFVNWREDGSGNTWTATIFADGTFNNHVGAQSVPQVTMNQNAEVYMSFTFEGQAYVEDASGNVNTITAPSGGWDFAVVKFDNNGDYVWHFVEGGKSNDYITDLYFDDNVQRLAIAGYVQGKSTLFLAGGAGSVKGITHPSTLGAGFEFGNAFAAVYEDAGGPSFFWVQPVDEPTYSHDVVMDPGGNVFLSGYLYEALQLAGIGINGNYLDGGIIYEHFLVGIDHGGPGGTAPVWAEVYGTKHNELEIATGKHLRHSSLGINRQSGDLYFAFDNTGSNSSGIFPEFGTYVCEIDQVSGVINNLTPVGVPFGSGVTPWSMDVGSPVYNPNIVVNDGNQVHISGNFLLSNDPGTLTGIGISFQEIQINNTYLDFSQMAGANAGHDEAVGWYTFTIDFATTSYVSEYLNNTYVPNRRGRNTFSKVPVYGTTNDEQDPDFFYTAVGFFEGEMSLDLTVNLGVFNNYTNAFTPTFDGFIVRSLVPNGFYAKPNDDNDVAQTTDDTRSLSDFAATAWTPQPNPAAAGSVVVLQGAAQQPDQVQLVSLTGRVLQTWQQPDLTTQGIQLHLTKDILPGIYFLRTSNGDQQQAASIVIR